MSRTSRIVLLDNGSLRADSVKSLRRLAALLSERVETRIDPVSLLHSSKIPAAELGGEAASTWRPYLRELCDVGVETIKVIPLFFGPSSAIVDYLPKVTRKTVAGEAAIQLKVARTLVDPEEPGDNSVARMLAKFVQEKMNTIPISAPPDLILVDHGSPQERVGACRDLVARQMGDLLGDRVRGVVASSMERRDGEAYDFNEPLLETALSRLDPQSENDAILCPMFLLPGRHAGPGGDIEQIVANARWARSSRRLPICPLVGESDELVELLERRYRELE